jgi:hypothetical protein
MDVVAERGNFVDGLDDLAVKRTRRMPFTSATARRRSTKFKPREPGSR